MQDNCPKCNMVKSGESCPRCGLVFAKFNETVFSEGVPHELVGLWQEVEKNWDKKELHAIFIERCMVLGEAGYAAARYRSRGGDAVAKAYLETISTRLSQMLNAVSIPPPKRATSRLGAVFILFIILAGLSLFLYYFSEFPE